MKKEKNKKCEKCSGVGYFYYIEDYPEAKYCMYCGRYLYYPYSKAESVLLHKEKGE